MGAKEQRRTRGRSPAAIRSVIASPHAYCPLRVRSTSLFTLLPPFLVRLMKKKSQGEKREETGGARSRRRKKEGEKQTEIKEKKRISRRGEYESGRALVTCPVARSRNDRDNRARATQIFASQKVFVDDT